jgi:hypothetical protein
MFGVLLRDTFYFERTPERGQGKPKCTANPWLTLDTHLAERFSQWNIR